MSVSNLEVCLSVTFVVLVIVLVGELFYVFHRRLLFRHHSSPPPPPPPIHNGGDIPDFSTVDAPTKELLYFFCLKPNTPVEPNQSGLPNINGSSQHEEVFKLLEANGQSKFICTIKEDVDSAHDVDFINKLTEKKVDVVEEKVCVVVDEDDGNMKTDFSTPCDSPLFLTPDGSPSHDFMVSECVVEFNETGNHDER